MTTEQRIVLGTSEQIAAERALLELLADPQILAVREAAEADLAASPRAKTEQGRTDLREAILRWTASLIMGEQANNPADPLILWTTDDAPHSWHGFTVPGRTAWGNDPNFIYRRTYLDGAGRYRITGHVEADRRPAQMTFEFMHGTPGDRRLNLQNRGKSMDFGNQIAMLMDQHLDIGADGGFSITVGGEAGGPAHVRTEPGPVAVTIRDVLSDWSQLPSRLSIRRLDSVQAAPRNAADVRAAVLASLPQHLNFWGTFPDVFYAKTPSNVLTGPVARDGGWGHVASMRFSIAADDVILIRTRRSAARYTGVQFSDAWGQTPDVQRHFSSLNNAQMVADADGGFTFAVAPTDPGIANWIDTAGRLDGGAGLRWQGFAPGADTADLVRDWRIAKRAELAALEGAPRVTPDQRKTALAERARQYRNRLGA